MTDASSFAARLRQVRSDAKLTQQELAERSGVHRQTIARLELGTREPTWATVQLLARALGVDCTAFTDPELQPPTEQPTKPRGRPRKADAATGGAQVEGKAPPVKKGKRKK